MSAVGSIGVTSLGANVAVAVGPTGPTIVKVTYVIVAGGGSGGTGPQNGGGGAGGVLKGFACIIKGTVLTIPIGSGGSAIPAPTRCTAPATSGMGGPSQIVWAGNTLHACGGGYGALSGLAPSPCFPATVGHPGGSGGGNGAISGTSPPAHKTGLGVPGQGYPGGGTDCNPNGPGYGGGGGAGGAGTTLPGGFYGNPGHSPTGPKAGCGGSGIAVLIKGPTSPITLAGGGGAGGVYQPPGIPGGNGYQGGCGGAGGGGKGFKTPSGSPPGTGGISGSPNTGGGGGGGGYHSNYPPTPGAVSYIGGNGGSGTVFISVPTPLIGTASGTFTCGPDGTGNTWFQFTSAGSYTT